MSNAVHFLLNRWPDTGLGQSLWLELLFASTLILPAAGVICLCLSRATAALRCRVLALAMVGLLCFPILSLCLPRLSPGFLADDRNIVRSEQTPPREPEIALTSPGFDRSVTVAAPISPVEYVPFEGRAVSPRPPLHIDNDFRALPEENISVQPLQVRTRTAAGNAESEATGVTGEGGNQHKPAGSADTVGTASGGGLGDTVLAWLPAMTYAWLAGMAIAVVMLLRSWLISRDVFRRATLPDDPTWQREIDAVSEKIGLRRKVIALICPTSSVPFVAGFGRKAVFLPPQCDAWDAGQRRAVLVHELTHVLRGDITLQLVVRVVGVLYWFQPLFWLAARRIRIEREMACDDAVLVYGERPSRYASLLLNVAAALKSRPGSVLGLSISMARRSRVEGRIRSILRTGRSRMPVGRKSALLLFCLTTLTVVSAAMFSPFEPPKFFAATQAAQTGDDENEAEETTQRSEELRKILENRLQATRDEVAAVDDALKNGTTTVDQYRDAKMRLLKIELELLEQFPDSLIEDYSNRVVREYHDAPLSVPTESSMDKERIADLLQTKVDIAERQYARTLEIRQRTPGAVTEAELAEVVGNFWQAIIERATYLVKESIGTPEEIAAAKRHLPQLHASFVELARKDLERTEAFVEKGVVPEGELLAARLKLANTELAAIRAMEEIGNPPVVPKLQTDTTHRDPYETFEAQLRAMTKNENLPIIRRLQTDTVNPVAPEILEAKLRALENRKLAAKAHLRFIFGMFQTGEKNGTAANLTDACCDFIDAQIQQCNFLLDLTLEESQKSQLLKYREELYAKAYVVAYGSVLAWQNMFDTGRGTHAELMTAKTRLSDLELRMAEQVPDLKIEEPEAAVHFRLDWCEALLESDLPPVEIRMDRQSSPIRRFEVLPLPAMAPEIFLAKKRALIANYKAAHASHEAIFALYMVGDHRGAGETEAKSRREVYVAQLELVRFLHDAATSENAKRELHGELRKLCAAKYAAERDLVFIYDDAYKIGIASFADLLNAQKMLPETELQLIELFPGEGLLDETGEFQSAKLETLVPVPLHTPGEHAPPQQPDEWLAELEAMLNPKQPVTQSASQRVDTAAETKRMVDEIFETMRNDGDMLKRYETYCSYSAETLDKNRADVTGSEVNGRNRLAWYDAMYREPLHSVVETEEYSRWLLEMLINDNANSARGWEEIGWDIHSKIFYVTDPRITHFNTWNDNHADMVSQIADLAVSLKKKHDYAFSLLDEEERDRLGKRVYAALCENARNGHFFANGGEAVQLLELMGKVKYNILAVSLQEVSLLADEGFTDALKTMPEDLFETKMYGKNRVQVVSTAEGDVLIGGREANVYELDAPEYANVIALIDLGGNDTYIEGACDLDRPVLIMIDLDGDDTYIGTKPGIQGASLLGISVLIDRAGNDSYTARDVAQGSSIGGIGLLIDSGGHDTYHALRRAQGQAFSGVGILLDRAGDDSYHAAMWAQGFGHTAGFGLLADLTGDDHYYLGGKYVDSYPEHPGYEAWGQGVGSGFRGSAGSACGGIGVLLDGEGDDLYEFDYMAHGGGYWLGVGIARDFGGNDRRIASTRLDYDGNQRREEAWQRHGCGFASHYALGFLFDDAGDDVYEGWIMGQGMGWDMATAFLCDFAGNDRYLAQGDDRIATLQGVGAESAIGVLFDCQGDDAYEGRPQSFADTNVNFHNATQSGGNFGFLVN